MKDSRKMTLSTQSLDATKSQLKAKQQLNHQEIQPFNKRFVMIL